MDNFDVPRKVNRHVLKAICSICQVECLEYAEVSDIHAAVKYSMRNLKPVRNLEDCINASLRALTISGVL
ncbi:CG5538, partial [Drosophila busckii]